MYKCIEFLTRAQKEKKKPEQGCCVRIGLKGCMHRGKVNSITAAMHLKSFSNTSDWVVNSQQILIFRGKNTINVKFILTFNF